MRTLESQVLKHYQTVNPSQMTLDTPRHREALLERRLRIFRDRLHLPPATFRGAQLLDMGCGTGEHSSVYASWGAFVTGVEFNRHSIDRLTHLFKEHNLMDHLTQVIEKPVSEWNPAQPPQFDLGISDGVIHHLDDPKAGFMKLASSVKPDGFVVISTGPIPGAEQRLLMQKLVRQFASNLEEAISLVKQWLPEYLERAVRFGYRTEAQVVSDNFFTPQNEPLRIGVVLGWLVETGLSLYRSWPPLEPNLADPASREEVQWWKPEYHSEIVRKASHWPYHTDGDELRCRNHFNEEELVRRKAQWEEESRRIHDLLQTKDREGLDRYLPTCRIFGRGVCGVGEWWVVGLKH